jgi:hypothetical protein
LSREEERREYRRKILAQLDEWIQRFHDLDFAVKPEADQKKYMDIPQALRIAFFPKDKSQYAAIKYTLSDILSIVLADYQYARTRYLMADVNYESHIFEYAESCLMVIQDLLARGLIEEREGMAQKLRKCADEKKQVEQDNMKLSQAYEKLKIDFESYRKHIHSADETGGEVHDNRPS